MIDMFFNLIIILFLIFKRKDVQNMAIIYATLIVNGAKTFSDVPEILKEQVKQVLTDLEMPELVK